MANVKVEVALGTERLVELEDVWQRLYEERDGEASTSFEWTQALIETNIEPSDRVSVVIMRRRAQVVGIIPLLVRTRKRRGQTVRFLRPISELYSTHSDLLAMGDAEDFVEPVLDALFRPDWKWDVFRMSRFREGDRLAAVLSESLLTRGARYSLREAEPTYFIQLPDTFDEYLRGRSHNFRKNLRKAGRKLLLKEGNAEVLCFQDAGGVERGYEMLLEVERESWKHVHGTSISRIRKQEKFFRILCERGSRKGTTVLLLLVFNGEPVAYDLGTLKGSRFFYLKTSFKEAYRFDSPAMLLRGRLLEMLIGWGVKEVDFTGEPFEWQTRWTDSYRSHMELTLYKGTMRSWLYSGYEAYKKWKGGGQENKGKFQHRDPKSIKAEGENP